MSYVLKRCGRLQSFVQQCIFNGASHEQEPYVAQKREKKDRRTSVGGEWWGGEMMREEKEEKRECRWDKLWLTDALFLWRSSTFVCRTTEFMLERWRFGLRLHPTNKKCDKFSPFLLFKEGGTWNEFSTIALKLDHTMFSLVPVRKPVITGIKRIHLRPLSAAGVFNMSTHCEKGLTQRYWVIFWVLWVTGSARNNPQGMGVTLKQVYPLPVRGGWGLATVPVFSQITVWAWTSASHSPLFLSCARAAVSIEGESYPGNCGRARGWAAHWAHCNLPPRTGRCHRNRVQERSGSGVRLAVHLERKQVKAQQDNKKTFSTVMIRQKAQQISISVFFLACFTLNLSLLRIYFVLGMYFSITFLPQLHSCLINYDMM